MKLKNLFSKMSWYKQLNHNFIFEDLKEKGLISGTPLFNYGLKNKHVTIEAIHSQMGSPKSMLEWNTKQIRHGTPESSIICPRCHLFFKIKFIKKEQFNKCLLCNQKLFNLEFKTKDITEQFNLSNF